MKALKVLTLVLVIVGGLNWGLVGLFDWDLVAALFGTGSMLTRLVYVLVAVSAIWRLVALVGVCTGDKAIAIRRRSAY